MTEKAPLTNFTTAMDEFSTSLNEAGLVMTRAINTSLINMIRVDPLIHYQGEYFLHQKDGMHYLKIPAQHMDTETLINWMLFNYGVEIDREDTNVVKVRISHSSSK